MHTTGGIHIYIYFCTYHRKPSIVKVSDCLAEVQSGMRHHFFLLLVTGAKFSTAHSNYRNEM